jgi:TatD DNase family protein
MMQLIDSHCHLHYDYTPKTSADLIREAALAGVNYLVSVGVDLDTLPAIQKISDDNKNVFHTAGIHPHDVSKMGSNYLADIKKFAAHPKCRAIGEIGLDYYYEHSPKDVQIKCFNEQLDLAIELNQPVVIHSRDAEDDLLKCLELYAKKLKTNQIAGALHCFTGSTKLGKACIDLGFVISFSGIITFKNADALRQTVADLPLEKMMVETDSPYLAPMPFRGKKCEPSMVKITAEKIAEIKNVSLEDVAQSTTDNAKKLFRII